MKKWLIRNNKVFLGILIGVVISYTVSVSANILFSASDVSVTLPSSGIDSVQDAIVDLNTKANYGNASENEVKSGSTVLVQGKEIIGKMTDNADWSLTPSTYDKIMIPEGYHDGNGYIDLSNLSGGMGDPILKTGNFPSSGGDVNGTFTFVAPRNGKIYLKINGTHQRDNDTWGYETSIWARIGSTYYINQSIQPPVNSIGSFSYATSWISVNEGDTLEFHVKTSGEYRCGGKSAEYLYIFA